MQAIALGTKRHLVCCKIQGRRPCFGKELICDKESKVDLPAAIVSNRWGVVWDARAKIAGPISKLKTGCVGEHLKDICQDEF